MSTRRCFVSRGAPGFVLNTQCTAYNEYTKENNAFIQETAELELRPQNSRWSIICLEEVIIIFLDMPVH